MNRFKILSVLLVMAVGLFGYGCSPEPVDELTSDGLDKEMVENYEFDKDDFIVLDHVEGFDKGAYFANGNQFFVNFHEGTDKVKQQMAFVKVDGQLTPVYIEMDKNEFPYFILCGDTWVHITDYNDYTMDFVVNRADSFQVYVNDVEHGIQFHADSRGWRENNFIRNTVGIGSMVIGGVEMFLGTGGIVVGAGAEAPTGGLSTAVVVGGVVATLGGYSDFLSGWDLIVNHDDKVFTQALADKLVDVSYRNLKGSLEDAIDKEGTTMDKLDVMLEKQDAYGEGEVQNAGDLKKLPFSKKVGLAKLLLGFMDDLFGKTRTEYQMLVEFYSQLSVMTEFEHKLTDKSTYISGYFYIPTVKGLEKTSYTTGAVMYEKNNPKNRFSLTKPTKVDGSTYYFYFDGLKDNTVYEYFVYFRDDARMLHRMGDTHMLRTQENAEKQILSQFYRDTNGDNWTNNTNWCTGEPLSEWYGIKVNEAGKVVSINLKGNNLGSVADGEYRTSPSLSDLACLTSLNLDNNAINGLTIQNCGNLDNVTFNNTFDGESDLRHDLFNVKVIGGKKLGGVWCMETSTSLVVKNTNLTGSISYYDGLESLTIDGCDFGDHTIWAGNCKNLTITNTKAHSVDGDAENCTITGGYFHHCGVHADYLSFINSTTYDTWFARTEKSMRLINSRCAVICGGDFTDSCSITVSGTYLDRPNWDDEDSNTYNFSCTGASWYKQFEYND